MKKTVVLHAPVVDVITVGETGIDKYYGVESAGIRGFITKKEYYRDGGFTIRAGRNITVGNCWEGRGEEFDSLKDAISYWLNLKRKIYQFDTNNELFAWLAEK